MKGNMKKLVVFVVVATKATFIALLLATVIAVPSLYSQVGPMGAGTEDRDWVTGPEVPPISPLQYTYSVVYPVWLTMRDGVQLEARLFLPSLPEGVNPGPCVLLSNGYGIGPPLGPAVEPPLRDLAGRGYAAVHVSLRASGNSGGVNNIYNLYGEDGYEIVEWMAKQPWCDGNVGMQGASLMGISQWLTAKQNPPSLKAIIPHVACGDCYDIVWYPGGMLPGPGRVARGAPEYPSAIQHRNYDDWWQERTTIEEDNKAIAHHGIAAMITGGWDDYISPANVRAYEEMTGIRKKLIMGPQAHGLSVPGLLPYDYQSYQVLWFDHWLKQAKNGVDKEPQVLIYVKGPNQWRYEKDWPIPGTHRARLYLRAQKSGTIASLNDGSLSKDHPLKYDPSAIYSYDPVAGPFLHTMLSQYFGRLTTDQTSDEKNVLTWTTDPLELPTEVTGWIKLNFWAAATADDTDFVLLLTDVAPDGKSTQVTLGYLNAPRYFSRSNPEPLAQGKIYEYELELWPTSYVFKAGHRIRLDIAGGTKEATRQVGPQGPGLNPKPATVLIYQDVFHPSHIEFPIIGTGWKAIAHND